MTERGAGRATHPGGLKRLEAVDAAGGVRFTVRQRRFEPLLRWLALAAATATATALLALAVGSGLPTGAAWRAGTVLAGLALFVAVLGTVAGALTVLPRTLLVRGRVAFRVYPLGIAVERPARRSTPRAMHRDEIAGPFVRVDEAIDGEASAATMMRMGGEEMATALAEGARATGGSADTMLWFLFAGSAGSVTVIRRGTTAVLAEALSRDEAEELSHAVDRALRSAAARAASDVNGR